HPARELPGPGRVRHLRLRPRRPGRHRPAHLHRLRLRRGAGGAGGGGVGGGGRGAALLRQPSGPAYAGVGLIEEAVKLAALWLLARRLPRYTMRDGIVLGAAVGLGFAALESAGYAFNALFTQDGGLSLVDLVET